MSWATFVVLWIFGSVVFLGLFAAALDRGRPAGWRAVELDRDIAEWHRQHATQGGRHG